MILCPKCNRTMRFNMEYSNGYPYVYYDCVCGYSTKNDYHYYTDNKTTMTKSSASNHT